MPAHKTTWAEREARFWSNLDYDGPVPEGRPELGPCWVWKLRRNNKGYGILTWYRIGTRTAHSVAYEFTSGLVPAGLELDHLCRNRACARPSHLEAVTRRENVRRGEPARRTHCPQGHEYTVENTQRTKTGKRSCRRCAYEKARARRQADPAAWAAYCRERKKVRNARLEESGGLDSVRPGQDGEHSHRVPAA